MQTGHLTAIATILLGLNTICCLRPTRHLDSSSSNELMLEDGVLVPANPSCEENWYYHNNSCYWFSTTRMDFHPAMESCAEKGAYLTDILSQEENTFLKDILMVINPKDGTDYWAGAMGLWPDHPHQWISGAPMVFTDFYPGANKAHKYFHMNFDKDFAWDTKWDKKDRDNRYICKKSV